MRQLKLGIISALLFIVSGAAFATPAPTTVGVVTSAGTLDCAKTSDGRCLWRSGTPSGYNTIGSTTYGPLSGSSAATDGRGTAISWGEADMASYLPSLHAYASSNGSWSPDFSALAGTVIKAGPPPVYYTGDGASVADANVWAAQGYQYMGATPFALSVTATLDSIFSASGDRGKVGHSTFILSIFSAEGYIFDQNYWGPNALRTLCPIIGNLSGVCPAGGQIIYDTTQGALNDSGALTQTVTHIIHPGDKFFIGAFMDASVCCGQTVDSSHSLHLSFNDFSQLASIDVPGVVPEPRTVLLLLTGLALMAWRIRPATRV
jgi:hypothetical protein